MSLIKSNKFKSVVYMSSSMLSLIFAFLINVIMTNYSRNSEVYGMYKYATNFILTIPAVCSLGVTWSCASLIASDVNQEKDRIISVSVFYTILIGVLSSIVLYMIVGISKWLNKPLFDNILIVFPFASVFLLQKLVNQIYTGLGESFKLSIYNVAPNLIIIIGLLIYLRLYGQLEYKFAILLYLFSYVVIIIPKLIGLKYDFSDFKKGTSLLFSDLQSNGFKVHLSSVFTTSSSQILALACGNMYGYSEYGYYSLAASLAGIFQIIGSSIAIVNFKNYANSRYIPNKDFIFMLLVGLTAYIFMCTLIGRVFFLFYPREYELAILYLKILSLSNLIYGFSTIFNRFFIGKSMGNIVMKNSFITAISTVIIEIPMIYFFEMKGMAIGAVLVSVVCIVAYFIDYRKYLGKLNYDK